MDIRMSYRRSVFIAHGVHAGTREASNANRVPFSAERGLRQALSNGLALSDERFQAIRDHGDDRAAFLGGDHPVLAEKFCIELERNVRLHAGLDVVRANVTTRTAR